MCHQRCLSMGFKHILIALETGDAFPNVQYLPLVTMLLASTESLIPTQTQATEAQSILITT